MVFCLISYHTIISVDVVIIKCSNIMFSKIIFLFFFVVGGKIIFFYYVILYGTAKRLLKHILRITKFNGCKRPDILVAVSKGNVLTSN